MTTALELLPSVALFSAVVFGRVIEGMPVVKRIEVCGTRSGKPNKRVQITESGQYSFSARVLVAFLWCQLYLFVNERSSSRGSRPHPSKSLILSPAPAACSPVHSVFMCNRGEFWCTACTHMLCVH
eukprot:scaffold61839_cov20-Tisochrysis_lutea.AAC.4